MEVTRDGSDKQLVVVLNNACSRHHHHLDISNLFSLYNALYFDDSLAACTISWTPRRTALAGIHYNQQGACEIYLSEPLLRPRGSEDVKNVILHEMIHAYMWVKNGLKNRSNHGPKFKALMRKVNSNSVPDSERPDGGYNVTEYHSFKNLDRNRDDICVNDSSKGISRSTKEVSMATPKRSSRVSEKSGDEEMKEKKRDIFHNSKALVSSKWVPCPVLYARKRTLRSYSDKSPEPKQRRIGADKYHEPKQWTVSARKNDMSKDNFHKASDLKVKIGQHIGSSKISKEICGLTMKQRHELEEEDKPLINKRTERRKLERMLEESRKWRVEEDIQPIQSCRTNRFVEQQVNSQAIVVFPGGHGCSSNTSNVEISD